MKTGIFFDRAVWYRQRRFGYPNCLYPHSSKIWLLILCSVDGSSRLLRNANTCLTNYTASYFIIKDRRNSNLRLHCDHAVARRGYGPKQILITFCIRNLQKPVKPKANRNTFLKISSQNKKLALTFVSVILDTLYRVFLNYTAPCYMHTANKIPLFKYGSLDVLPLIYCQLYLWWK